MVKNFKFNYNNKGFTLIELMIVIAIIGILAAIAVPNFIAYRNKAFCSRAESDANNIAISVADYFAIPTNTAITEGSITFKPGENTFTIEEDPSTKIIIKVTDVSGRCPAAYQTESPAEDDNLDDGWIGTTNVYRKVMQ